MRNSSVDNLKIAESIHAKSRSNAPFKILTDEIFSPVASKSIPFSRTKQANLSATRLTSPSKLTSCPSSPKRASQDDIARSPVALIDKINYAPYMIFFPPEEILQEAKQTQVKKNNFLTFKTLVGKGVPKMTTNQSNELFSVFESNMTLKKQLNFNKEQEILFRRSANTSLSTSRSALALAQKEKEDKLKKMPKIRIQPSAKYAEPQKLIFDEELSHKEGDDEEKNLIRHPKYIKFMKFGPHDKYNFHWSIISDPEHSTWRPVSRESASFLVLGKYAYLYGGRSKDLNNDLSRLDITKWKWEQPVSSNEIPPFGRFGHTANVYKNMMLIFGGVKSYNATLNIRECLNDVRLYNTESNEWSYVKCSGDFIEPRRHHTAIIIGKHLLIHGGIGSRGEYLHDMKCLDLVSARWADCQEINKEPTGIAFHKSCLVIHEQRIEPNLYKMFDLKSEDKSPMIKEEGIYFFGGRHFDDSISNTLKILKIGQSPFRWITPETAGKPPEARYLHTMVHSKSLNMLVIYGGRNDNLFSRGEQPILGDFFTLQLETMTWVGVSAFGTIGNSRFSHVSVAIGTSLIIFGGMNLNVYCSPEINLIEMDQMVVNKLMKSQRGSKRSELIPKHQTERFNPEVKMADSNSSEPKYAGITSFLPVPNPNKRKKEQSVDLSTLFRDYFMTTRAAHGNQKMEL